MGYLQKSSTISKLRGGHEIMKLCGFFVCFANYFQVEKINVLCLSTFWHFRNRCRSENSQPPFLAVHIVNCTKSTQHLQIYFLLLLSFKIRDFYLFSHLEWKSQEKSFVKLSKTESTVNLGLIVILLKNVEK